jgi:hypothetical protein
VEEKEVLDLVETKSIRFCLGEMEDKNRGCSQRRQVKDIFALVAHSRNRLSCKKK